ncbi:MULTISPECIES: lipopolysaccharide assembly protein LapB [Asticcacaulis]|uniref:tetratricopeptide repeat protein n=1 Tax=Asticcacaulis TaxID=76890 RepID=UPI001AE4C3E2|nr:MULTISPECIES: tetratricopeptide repeat protein [Asticcacaulis]MBP2161158.1 tetratricopeptide (TPR) repeat protein [Asticcacaulis solisilvae]MDR6802203.1 tetratricopeptide (TPR) repeat protein [Asticcacaulis sp. BE141]
MNVSVEVSVSQDKLSRLLGYLDHDSGNLNLIAEAASTALEAGQAAKTIDLLGRYEAITQLPLALLNLRGMAALRLDRFDDALEVFEVLFLALPDEAAIRFNLAWSATMLGNDRRAADVLDEATLSAVPGAAALKVQALHRQGLLEEALELGTGLAEQYPQDEGLLGALSLVAIDSQMPELALAYASKSAGTAEGLSTLGMLTLQKNNIDDALNYFESGLSARPDSARNLLGKGLALMAAGNVHDGADYLDKSAAGFGNHLGTWIASGWAHFAKGDHAKARTIFEHALALDDTFSESHGALAVLDILDGNIAGARDRTETALRLDRRCFSGALAKSLLFAHDGDDESAQRVRQLTLNTPVGDSGSTISDAMVAMASRWRV